MNNDFKLLSLNIRYNYEKKFYEFEANYENNNSDIFSLSCESVSVPNDFIQFSMMDCKKEDFTNHLPSLYTKAYYSIILNEIDYLSKKNLSIKDSITFLKNENDKYANRIKELKEIISKERIEREKDNKRYKKIIKSYEKIINSFNKYFEKLQLEIHNKLFNGG